MGVGGRSIAVYSVAFSMYKLVANTVPVTVGCGKHGRAKAGRQCEAWLADAVSFLESVRVSGISLRKGDTLEIDTNVHGFGKLPLHSSNLFACLHHSAYSTSYMIVVGRQFPGSTDIRVVRTVAGESWER